MKPSYNDIWMCVSVTVLIIPILLVAGCTSSSSDDEDDASVRITLALDKVESNLTDSPVTWNAFIWVDNIEPADYEISWVWITIDVVEGGHYNEVMVFHGVYEYDDRRVNRDNQGVYREDLSGDTRTIDIMDMIVIHKMTEEFEGCLVRIHYKAESCGSVYLPDDFS